jgi:hypothetical protein
MQRRLKREGKWELKPVCRTTISTLCHQRTPAGGYKVKSMLQRLPQACPACCPVSPNSQLWAHWKHHLCLPESQASKYPCHPILSVQKRLARVLAAHSLERVCNMISHQRRHLSALLATKSVNTGSQRREIVLLAGKDPSAGSKVR